MARGFALLLRRPRLFVLGALPALITSLLFLALFVVLVINLTDLAEWATPFAADWGTIWRNLIRGAVAVGVLAGTVLVMVVSFTTITLALGAPIYDKITELVEEELGNAPAESDESFWSSLGRSIRQSLVIITASLLVTILVFFIGLVPLAGQVIGPVLAALLGGWLLGIELVAGAFDRRRLITIKERRRWMGTRRLRVLGFTVPTYLLLAIPFVAVVVFPAAAAGGTILARELLGVPEAPEGVQGSPENPRIPPPPAPPQGA
ncbi:EI24 domain-containing protein [Nocardiopsis sp. N85]|uniref:EI24 domain-containing protein n=1 Tax=Nocardiopsis sp. N85 TaxID=3029400 RepID=UPI00237F76D1|nr:EI24 domain-containing protein [Nocardiopsis sp. N85]MDE3721633.1 EI24 domain-containing protein [Nocardiopsis sp. N85]